MFDVTQRLLTDGIKRDVFSPVRGREAICARRLDVVEARDVIPGQVTSRDVAAPIHDVGVKPARSVRVRYCRQWQAVVHVAGEPWLKQARLNCLSKFQR